MELFLYPFDDTPKKIRRHRHTVPLSALREGTTDPTRSDSTRSDRPNPDPTQPKGRPRRAWLPPSHSSHARRDQTATE